MNTLILKITLAITLLFNILGYGQEKLNTVFIDDSKTTNSFNDFETFNKQLASNNTMVFKEELIKDIRKGTLTYQKGTNRFTVSKSSYLKALKRSLKKTNSFTNFIDRLTRIFPTLENEIIKDVYLRDIYFSSQKNAFNAYIANLPSVL